MKTKLHVGNVPSDTTESDLKNLFSPHGTISEIYLVMDRSVSRPRGFAFVTMDTLEGAKAAKEALNGETLGGRFITVTEARPREDRPADSPAGARSSGRSYSHR